MSTFGIGTNPVPVHFVRGEIADDPYDRYLQIAPSWARRFRTDSWPVIEDYEWGYVMTWRHEGHVNCSCRRHRALLRSWMETPILALDGPNRFPDSDGFWERPEPTNDLVDEADEWGSRLGLALVSIRPAYIHELTPSCSWDEAWGGVVTHTPPRTKSAHGFLHSLRGGPECLHM
jgi:hypothetical protein